MGGFSFWTVLVLVVILLGWLACNYFWRYYALFKHLFWGSLALLIGFLSYDYGVERGAWAVGDIYQGVREVRADSPSNGLNPTSSSDKAQEDAKIPYLYAAVVAGFLIYCILMLLVGGRQIVTNSARKTGSKGVERDGLFDQGNSTLSR